MHYSIAFLLYAFAISSCSVTRPMKVIYDLNNVEELFVKFVQKYDKIYNDNEEFRMRLGVFNKTLEYCNEVNTNGDQKLCGINSLSDYTDEEFEALLGCATKDDLTGSCGSIQYSPSGSPPASLDYREKNLVTDVKDQKQCGSCYAFSSVGAVEAQYALNTNQLISLSPQQIVDCDKGNDGCGGGWMTSAFSYLMDGVEREADYPYVASVQTCAYDSSKVVTRVSKCNALSFNQESDMKSALAQFGPLSVGVNAHSLHQYPGGIITDCAGGKIDHAVLLVGYGVEGNEEYWIVKNSWGSGWGEGGYFRLKIGSNLCSIADGVVSVQL